MERVSTTKRSYAVESKDFWREPILGFNESGLTKVSYCKANGINYYRFMYWKKVLSDKKSTSVAYNGSSVGTVTRLLPVEIKGEGMEKTAHMLGLCSVEFKSGVVLRIHEEQVIGLIVGRLS